MNNNSIDPNEAVRLAKLAAQAKAKEELLRKGTQGPNALGKAKVSIDPEDLQALETLIDTVDTDTWNNISPPVVDFASKMMAVMLDLREILKGILGKAAAKDRYF